MVVDVRIHHTPERHIRITNIEHTYIIYNIYTYYIFIQHISRTGNESRVVVFTARDPCGILLCIMYGGVFPPQLARMLRVYDGNYIFFPNNPPAGYFHSHTLQTLKQFKVL